MTDHNLQDFGQPVCRPFYHRGNGNAILLIHGFTGCCSHMRKIADVLSERGYTVQTINLPGHASIESEMAKYSWKDWLDACRNAAEMLRRESDTLTVSGLSMGGVLSLLLAEEIHPDACVPISAPMAVQNKLLPFAGLMYRLYPRVSDPNPSDRYDWLDPEYDYEYEGFPTKSGADLYHLIRLARTGLKYITCPLLCVQSTGDRTIWSGSGEYILKNIVSEEKELVMLKDAPHCCTISGEYRTIADKTDELMKRISKPAAQQ